MGTSGNAAHAVAALCFAALTMLLCLGSRRTGRVGAWLILASALTSMWSAVVATSPTSGYRDTSIVLAGEALCEAAWLAVLASVAADADLSRRVPILLGVASMALFLLALVGELSSSSGGVPGTTGVMLPWSMAGAALIALLSMGFIYRQRSAAQRRAMRSVFAALGLLFGSDLLLQMNFLFGEPDARELSISGLGLLASAPLLAVGIRRNSQWALDIFVSRQVVFRVTTLLGATAYVVLGLAGAIWVREHGGGLWAALFLGVLLLALGVMLASGSLRRRIAVFISKHFYRNKYDYRLEWLRFSDTLCSRQERDIRRTCVRAVAQIFASPGGVLLVREEGARRLTPVAAWPMALEDVPGVAALPEDSDFARFIERTQWIVDLKQHRASPERYGNAALPAWMREPRLRIVSPILQRGRLTGLFVLYDPPGCFELTYEDRDLLRAVGRHVATHLAQHEADRRLTESQQFETYNRLTAFVMHDLKNAVAPLKLVVANAHRHRGNASFIEDAMFTVENATARIGRLVEELNGASSPEELQPTCLRDATRRAIEHCRLRPSVGSSVTFQQEGTGTMLVRAHPDRLTRVIEHVIRNAQDASAAQRPVSVTLSATAGEAFLTVTDHGCGMAPEFVRERLFRPFDTTKGSGSMGVGAYQVRDYAQALGGRVEVESAIGGGTSFRIILPLSGAEAATVPLAGAVPL